MQRFQPCTHTAACISQRPPLDNSNNNTPPKTQNKAGLCARGALATVCGFLLFLAFSFTAVLGGLDMRDGRGLCGAVWFKGGDVEAGGRAAEGVLKPGVAI